MSLASSLATTVIISWVLVVVWIANAWFAGSTARRKGRSFAIYFVAALIVGPVLGLLVTLFALLVPARQVSPS